MSLTVKRIPWIKLQRMRAQMGVTGPNGWLAFQRAAMDRHEEIEQLGLSREDRRHCWGIKDDILYIEDNRDQT